MKRQMQALGLAFAALIAAATWSVLEGAETARWPASKAAALSARKPAIAVVLGMGPAPGLPLLDRAELAAELWADHVVEKIVASGGQGADESEPEADTLARALMDRGVPAAAILRERASRNTRENLELTRALLATERLVPGTLILVTHDYHAARAGGIARGLGLEVTVAGAAGLRLNSRPARVAREVLATIKWWVLPVFFGW